MSGSVLYEAVLPSVSGIALYKLRLSKREGTSVLTVTLPASGDLLLVELRLDPARLHELSEALRAATTGC